MKHKHLLLAMLSGLLMWLGWPPINLPWLLFVGWVPLLIIEKETEGRNLRFFALVCLALFLWNLGTTWWVWYASPGGCVTMLVANTLLMALVWMAFRMVRRSMGNAWGYLSLPVFWLAFEYFHYNWQSAYPWLSLGNGLSLMPWAVQWYSVTGVGGGSLWIIAVNFFIFFSRENRKRMLPAAAAMLLMPVVVSIALRPQVKSDGPSYEVLILQPSFDPYNEKFDRDPADQLKEMLDTARAYITADTRIVLMPETALVGNLDEDDLEREELVQMCRAFISRFPHTAILAGADTRRIYQGDKPPNHTARATSHPRLWVDYYNAALWIDSTPEIGVCHKSKLVPGVEKMPYKKQLAFLEKLTIDMGGTSGSLGYEDTTRVLGNPEAPVGTAICYESVFGDWCADYCRKGAKLLAIVTNDGWWRETAGHKQHLYYGALRAIENRRWMVRSANTGISALIDPAGNIVHDLGWWKKGAMLVRIDLLEGQTFYTRHGDWPGRWAAWGSGVLLVSFLLSVTKRKGP